MCVIRCFIFYIAFLYFIDEREREKERERIMLLVLLVHVWYCAFIKIFFLELCTFSFIVHLLFMCVTHDFL